VAAATKLLLLVDQGGTNATVLITIATTSGDPEIIFTQAAAVARSGFWTDDRSAFYPAVSIRKITPQ